MYLPTGRVRCFLCLEDDEAELTSPATDPIEGQFNALHAPVFGEVLFDVLFRHVSIDSADENLLTDRTGLCSLWIDDLVTDFVGPVVQDLGIRVWSHWSLAGDDKQG